MNQAHFRVQAAAGMRVPYETKARKFITDSVQVTVPATAYYLRRLADGELVDLDGKETDALDPPAPRAARGKTKSKQGA